MLYHSTILVSGTINNDVFRFKGLIFISKLDLPIYRHTVRLVKFNDCSCYFLFYQSYMHMDIWNRYYRKKDKHTKKDKTQNDLFSKHSLSPSPTLFIYFFNLFNKPNVSWNEGFLPSKDQCQKTNRGHMFSFKIIPSLMNPHTSP